MNTPKDIGELRAADERARQELPLLFFDTAKAAELLGFVNEETGKPKGHIIRRMIQDGELRAIRRGSKYYLIAGSAILEYYDSAHEPIRHPDSFGRAS